MQNAERRIENEETANFSILHSAFCVLHSSDLQHNLSQHVSLREPFVRFSRLVE